MKQSKMAKNKGNMGKAHEDLGNVVEARHYYERAEGACEILAENRYGDIVRDAVRRGLERLTPRTGY